MSLLIKVTAAFVFIILMNRYAYKDTEMARIMGMSLADLLVVCFLYWVFIS